MGKHHIGQVQTGTRRQEESRRPNIDESQAGSRRMRYEAVAVLILGILSVLLFLAPFIGLYAWGFFLPEGESSSYMSGLDLAAGGYFSFTFAQLALGTSYPPLWAIPVAGALMTGSGLLCALSGTGGKRGPPGRLVRASAVLTIVSTIMILGSVGVVLFQFMVFQLPALEAIPLVVIDGHVSTLSVAWGLLGELGVASAVLFAPLRYMDRALRG